MVLSILLYPARKFIVPVVQSLAPAIPKRAFSLVDELNLHCNYQPT